MSYLIDALKKAERERRTSQRSDLQSASAADEAPQGRRFQSLVIGVVVVLLAINGALVYRMWFGQPPSDDQKSQAPDVLPDEAQPEDSLVSAAERPTAIERPSRALGTLRLSDGPPPSVNESPARASDQPSSSAGLSAPQNGSVRYSRTPLDADSSGGTQASTSSLKAPVDKADAQDLVEDVPAEDVAENLPDQSQVTGAPDIQINGQLYSSVPGRSFILVEGRRFHEGERLPQGPAIESITPTGATLRYRGKRYHVTGP